MASPNLPCEVPDEQPQGERFQQELHWCISKLELGLQRQATTPVQATETVKLLKILKSKKAPIAKKRQIMRNALGDYRKKMKQEEKKSITGVRHSHFVSGGRSTLRGRSRFLRHSTKLHAGDSMSPHNTGEWGTTHMDQRTLHFNANSGISDAHNTGRLDDRVVFTPSPSNTQYNNVDSALCSSSSSQPDHGEDSRRTKLCGAETSSGSGTSSSSHDASSLGPSSSVEQGDLSTTIQQGDLSTTIDELRISEDMADLQEVPAQPSSSEKNSTFGSTIPTENRRTNSFSSKPAREQSSLRDCFHFEPSNNSFCFMFEDLSEEICVEPSNNSVASNGGHDLAKLTDEKKKSMSGITSQNLFTLERSNNDFAFNFGND